MQTRVYLSHNITNDTTVIILLASEIEFIIDATQGVYYFEVFGENTVGNGSINSTLISKKMFITINTCCDNYYFLVNDGYAVVTVNETSSSCYSNCTNNDNSNNNNISNSTHSTDTINSPSTTSDNIATYHYMHIYNKEYYSIKHMFIRSALMILTWIMLGRLLIVTIIII